MKSLIKKLLREGLNESKIKSSLKGKNILYHNIRIGDFKSIINNNELKPNTKQEINTRGKGGEVYGVSLTRDSEFIWASQLQLILDGDLIKRDYGKKLTPLDYLKGAVPKHNKKRGVYHDHQWSDTISAKHVGDKLVDVTNDVHFNDYEEGERYKVAPNQYQAEEFLIGGLKNLNKYLIAVRIRVDLTYGRFNKSARHRIGSTGLNAYKQDAFREVFELLANNNDITLLDMNYKELDPKVLLDDKTDLLGDRIISDINNGKRVNDVVLKKAFEVNPNFTDKLIDNDINKISGSNTFYMLPVILDLSKDPAKILHNLNSDNIKKIMGVYFKDNKPSAKFFNLIKKHKQTFPILSKFMINYVKDNGTADELEHLNIMLHAMKNMYNL